MLAAAALTLLLVLVPVAVGADGVGSAPQVAPLGAGPQTKAQAPAAALAPSGPGGVESNAPAPTTGVNFLATTFAESGFIPPDTTGDVGPSRIAVPLNGRMKIFDKAGAVQYTDTLNNFFGSVRNSQNAFDSRVEYDRLSGRWFITAINGSATNNRVMIAYSSGPTINGIADFTFTFFVHDAPSGSFGDYTTFGVDKNALYIGTNNFAPGYTGSSLYVLDKADLLGGTITRTSFNVGTSGTGMFAPHVAHNDDPNATVGYLVGVDNAAFNTIDVRRVLDPAGTPTLTAQQQITVPTTSFSCNIPIPGAGAGFGLDALDDRLYEPMIQKDPATGQPRLWTAHNLTVNAAGVAVAASGSSDCAGAERIASRYYEIGSLDTTPSLVQSGTLFDPAAAGFDHFSIPSIAANGQGHAVMGATVSSPSRPPGVALTQRFNGESAGALSPFTLAQAGTGNYQLLDTANRNRWGDYSQVVVDPNDDMTFWAFQEYVSATNQWAVRVIQVKAPLPATPASSSPATVGAGQASVPVTITGTSTNGSGFFDPGPDTGGPGFANDISATVSGGVTVNSVSFTDPTHVTLDLNTTGASNGPKDVTITNPDGQTATGVGILTVSGAVPPPPPNLTSTSPASPANDNSPEIIGTAPAGTNVTLYQTNNCTGAIEATGTAAQLASPGLTASVLDNTTSDFSATATGPGGTSLCSNSISYTEVTPPPPAAPNLTSTSPASPANDNNPEIIGTAPAGTNVTLYQTNNCTGAIEATGTAAQLTSPGLTASVLDNTTSDFSATATNVNGTSVCSNSISYTEVTPPAAPNLTSTSPASPANDNSPEIIGTAPAGTTVNLFQTNNCTGAVEATGTAAQLTSPGLTASVLDNTTSDFSATATNVNGTSVCSNSISYAEVTPPAAPNLTSTSPASPANDNSPEIIGTAPAGTNITLYQTNNCTGAVEATGTAAQLTSPGLTASVLDNTTSDFSATATNVNGTSVCSNSISYTEVTPPAAPNLTSTSPASGANDNNPEIIGSAPAGTTVNLYATNNCSGPVAASGSAAQLASPGLTASVGDNTTTPFSATATNVNGTSVCSNSVSYAEVTPPPPSAKCAGRNATKVGTAGPNVINGTAGRDIIAGLGGNDTIRGRGGNDLVCGGAGRDKEVGGAGRDTLLGQAGNDRLLGGAGRDILRGGPGRDTLIGGPGLDVLSGGPGVDIQVQ